jgi:hypothetical protein
VQVRLKRLSYLLVIWFTVPCLDKKRIAARALRLIARFR